MYTLLIADDEPLIRNGVKKIIDWESLGFSEIFLAEDGQEALDIIRKNHVDLVLTDIVMPFMDGLELTEILSREFPQIHVVILTGHEDFQYAQKSVGLGVKNYILKPIGAESLYKEMKEICEKLHIENSQRQYIQSMKNQLRQSLPVLQEQTLNKIVCSADRNLRLYLERAKSLQLESELASKIQSLHIFFSLLIPDMSHEEKQLLDGAMVTCYQEKGITHDNLSLTDPEHPGKYKKMPILGDLHEVLMRKEECRRMANILNRLVSGSASSFNQQTNVDLENKYVVLDISELSGDLLLGMFVALDFVWTKTKEDRTVEKAVFVDEAWKLLMSNDLAGEYLIEIFKTIRAYGGSAICATQDLADCFAVRDGKLGRGILSNSKTKIVLNMEVSEAERIQEELDLSEAETNSIIHFERGNGLISTNNNNLIVEFKASALEKDLITTDRKDLQELKDRIRKYGTDAYGRK